MTRETKSERLFRDFCAAQGIKVSPVPTAAARTPDFRIYPRGVEVVCEVKEIESNPAELAAEREFEATGVHPGTGGIVGDRARGKIRKASKQFKDAADSGLPAMLILWAPFLLGREVEPHAIHAAMYGHHTLSVHAPPVGGGSPKVVGAFAGGSKSMTADHNTRFSALAVIGRDAGGGTVLNVYHNDHAARPIDHGTLSFPGIAQHVSDGTKWQGV